MSYRVVRPLPGGGFSDLFEVEDPASALPERLILKRLNAEMSARPAVRAAFADEAKILRELKHPNIVTFRRCYFDEEQRVCLLMEKVAGEALDAWVRRRADRPDRVLDVFEKVLHAVEYLHRRPVPFLHLDLKPDNILVSSTPEGPVPVLIDFGIARRSGGQGLKAYTPPYGAPEQQAGRTLDCATDVHALGQILAELLETLALPASPAHQALLAVAAKARDPVRRSRFADAGELGLAFRRARRSTPLPAAGAAPARQPSTRNRLPGLPRWVMHAVAVTLGLVLLMGLLRLAASVLAPADPEPAGTAALAAAPVRERFDSLLIEARTEAGAGRFTNADRAIQEARVLWQSIPPDSADARRMARDLEASRSEIDLRRRGGFIGEGVRLVQ